MDTLIIAELDARDILMRGMPVILVKLEDLSFRMQSGRYT